MVTFGSKISTEGGITGKGGTIATKEARKKDEAKKKGLTGYDKFKYIYN